MDPERIGTTTEDGQVTDLGDNVLKYKGGEPLKEESVCPWNDEEMHYYDTIPHAMSAFLTTKWF